MLYAYTVWLTPLWSAFPGLGTGALCILSAIKCISSGTLTAFLYGSGLPTAAATLAWQRASRNSLSLFVIWPVVAFSLFAACVGLTPHLGYAAYWLIVPMLYACIPSVRSTLLFKALMVSMTAHTIGALLVVFFGTFSQWSSLIAVVPFERLVTTLSIAGVAMGMKFVRTFVARTYTRSETE